MSAKQERDEEREERIRMEIVVDAYDSEEMASGWYYYLEQTLECPFPAICRARRVISPLKVEEAVLVVGMAPASECEHEMFVLIDWGEDQLGVPLSQLEPLETDDEDEVGEQTAEAVADWHYWVERGYQFEG